jgi:hypothetical protein
MWGVVAIALAVLSGAATFSQIPLSRLASAWAPLARAAGSIDFAAMGSRATAALAAVDVAAALESARRALEALARSEALARVTIALASPETLRLAIPGVLAAMLAAWTIAALARRARGPRGRVLAMARRGQPLSRIARRTGLARDAVRQLLGPDAPARPELPAGSFFRPATPAAPSGDRSPASTR